MRNHVVAITAGDRFGHCPTVTMKELPHGDGWIIVGGGWATGPWNVSRCVDSWHVRLGATTIS
jgi:hypothetical protein